ncbi:MAG TPA: DUF4184 family protein [Longimicrobiaceae bacterium]|nr:DUF4184 family protein [Longimicrobiaceae bacterium]
MPITPAHAAAAWPIHRAAKRLPLAALVVGTFAPDLEYVPRLQPVGKFGHTPAGLVVFCLPATLVVFWVWRTLVRPALTPLLPAGIRTAAEAPPPGRRSDLWPLAIVAALLGAATHIFWDGFTHLNGWGVALFPVLLEPAPGVGMQWFYLAQYASSVVGVMVIAAWIFVTLRRFPPEARRFAPGQLARLVRVVLFIAAAALAAAAANASISGSWILALGRAAVGFELGLAVGLVAYAVHVRR